MKIIVAPRAERDLSRQIEYLVSRNAATAARRLHSRITVFVERMLAKHPRVGTFLTHRDLWETWVPGTRLVVGTGSVQTSSRLFAFGTALKIAKIPDRRTKKPAVSRHMSVTGG